MHLLFCSHLRCGAIAKTWMTSVETVGAGSILLCKSQFKDVTTCYVFAGCGTYIFYESIFYSSLLGRKNFVSIFPSMCEATDALSPVMELPHTSPLQQLYILYHVFLYKQKQ